MCCHSTTLVFWKHIKNTLKLAIDYARITTNWQFVGACLVAANLCCEIGHKWFSDYNYFYTYIFLVQFITALLDFWLASELYQFLFSIFSGCFKLMLRDNRKTVHYVSGRRNSVSTQVSFIDNSYYLPLLVRRTRYTLF